ncbi:MAG: MaoC family dehydratase [Pseudoclavibacter sp.]
MTAIVAELSGLGRLVGLDLEETSPRLITQADVDAFAALTGDRQWIHVDPARAAAAGGTIAHGAFVLSLVGGFWAELLDVRGASRALNYGFDRVRFIAPVPVGASVRASAKVADVTERAAGCCVALEVSVRVDGSERPAIVATSIVLFQP